MKSAELYSDCKFGILSHLVIWFNQSLRERSNHRNNREREIVSWQEIGLGFMHWGELFALQKQSDSEYKSYSTTEML